MMDKQKAAQIVDEAISAYMDGPLSIKQAAIPTPAGVALFEVIAERPILGVTGHLGYVNALKPGETEADAGVVWRRIMNGQLHELRGQAAASVGGQEFPLSARPDGDALDLMGNLEGGAEIELSLRLVPVNVQFDDDEKIPFTVAGIISTWLHEDGGERAEAASIIFADGGGHVMPDAPARQDTHPVHHQLLPLAKALTKIREEPPALYDSETDYFIDVANDKEKAIGKEVLVALSIDIEQTEAQISRPLSSFDVDVHNALGSLWHAGNRVFTYQQVFRTLTGSRRRISDNQLERVIRSCDILMRAQGKLDYTQQAKARGYDVAHAKVKGALISAYEHDIELTNGMTAKGLVMLAPPMLFEYADEIAEITSVPQSLLETDEAGPDSEEHIVLKRYLLERIKQMQNHKAKADKAKRSHRKRPESEEDARFHRIRYESAYKRAGVNTQDRHAKARANGYMLACLDIWQKRGFIKGYDEIRDGSGARSARVAVDIRL